MLHSDMQLTRQSVQRESYWVSTVKLRLRKEKKIPSSRIGAEPRPTPPAAAMVMVMAEAALSPPVMVVC